MDRNFFRRVAPPTTEEGVVRIGLESLLALHEGSRALGLEPRQVRAWAPGGHRSVFKGRGMEFDEVRPYIPGDDVRSIDWRVMARTGRPHTKIYREERERAVLFWIDLRPAMFFATRGAFKAVRAAQVASLLGWCALRQGDRLGALLFDGERHVEIRPRRGRAAFIHLLSQLAEHPSWERRMPGEQRDPVEAMNQALARLDRVVQPGSLIVLLTDLSLIDGDGAVHLAQLSRHNEILLVQVHDPLDAELPPAGTYRVSDGERFLALETGDARRRERYRRQHAERQEALKALCRRKQVTWLPVSTAEDPLSALQRVLGVRP